MNLCPQCGNKFKPDQKHFWICPECYTGLAEGNATNFTVGILSHLAQALDGLQKSERSWGESDLKFVADSAAFPFLLEKVMPLMENEQLVNLLKKVAKVREGLFEQDYEGT